MSSERETKKKSEAEKKTMRASHNPINSITRAPAMSAPPPVQVAAAGDLVHDAPRSHRDCVAGGVPAFPGDRAPVFLSGGGGGRDGGGAATPSCPLLRRTGGQFPPPCPLCATPTVQAVQVHAPRPGSPDRALYLFCCMGEACAASEGGWVGWVAGLMKGGGGGSPPAPSPPPAAPAAAAPATTTPSSTVFGGGGGGDGWGDSEDDDGGDSAAPSTLDLASLTAELAAAGAALERAGPGGTGRSTGQQQAGVPPAEAASHAPHPPPPPSWSPPPATPSTPALPCFWVGWTAEPAAPPPPAAADDAHIAALLAAYRAEEGGEGSEEEEALPDGEAEEERRGKHGVPSSPSAAPSPATAAAASWAGEAYEPDAAPGADPAYLRFARRLERAPGQVARYLPPAPSKKPSQASTDEAPAPPPSGLAWPSPAGPPAAPPCLRCGSPRSPELQVVAPLASILEEAAQWERGARGEEGAPSSSLPPPKAWQWLTVGLWTCDADCAGRGVRLAEGVGWVAEEWVAAVNE